MDTPLLLSDAFNIQAGEAGEESGAVDDVGCVAGRNNRNMPSSGGSNNSSLARRCVHRLLQVRTAADSLPIVLFSLVTNGKTVALALLVSYIVLVFMWLPFWLLSFVVTEWGIYMLAVATIVFCGRCIIRLIAFPGASQKVTAEVETEFAKYSVRILDSAATSFIEVASVVSAASGAADQPAFKGMNTYELPLLWRRAKTFRNRVIAVYLDVLIYLYQEPTDGHGPPNNVAQDITRYGNNRLSGDVGDLSDLTVRYAFNRIASEIKIRLL